MIRFALPILCLVLAIAGIARFRAEAAHREAAGALAAAAAERTRIELAEHRLKLEVEVLESSSRLSSVNERTVRLGAARADQLTDRTGFAGIIGRQGAMAGPAPSSDVIGNAIAMTDPSVPVSSVPVSSGPASAVPVSSATPNREDAR